MMTYLSFTVRAFGGFIVAILLKEWIDPTTGAYRGIFGNFQEIVAFVCVVSFGLLFALVQTRVHLSVMTRKLLPVCYGWCFIPVLYVVNPYAASFLQAHLAPTTSIWTIGFIIGSGGAVISFAISCVFVKVVDVVLPHWQRLDVSHPRGQ